MHKNNLFLSEVQRSGGLIALVAGNRSSAIQMMSLYFALKNQSIASFFCFAGESAIFLQEVIKIWGIHSEVFFPNRDSNYDLQQIMQTICAQTAEVLKKTYPALAIVQGDTSASAAMALAFFYLGIPLIHVESEGKKAEPTEVKERHHRLISLLSSYHFAPTQVEASQLFTRGAKEGAVFQLGSGSAAISSDLKEWMIKVEEVVDGDENFFVNNLYGSFAQNPFLFDDGQTSERMARIIKSLLKDEEI